MHEKEHPVMKVDYVGKDGTRVFTPLEAPLTNEGFSQYCWEKVGAIKDYMGGKYEDFSEVCSRIKECIRQDQIRGGMAGIYNASITQRLNGLVEKQSVEVKTEQPLFPDK
jgi:hypothetical protein